MAPSTVGTFLRSFTWGHTRQLDKALGEALGRAWEAGVGPGDDAVTLDLDSTICEVSGRTKGGGRFLWVYECVGLSPPGSNPGWYGRDSRDAFAERSVAAGCGPFRPGDDRTCPAGRRFGHTHHTGRADSGFWSYEMFQTLDRVGVLWYR